MIDISYFSFVLVICAIILIKRIIEFTYMNIFHIEDSISYDMSNIHMNNTHVYNRTNEYNSSILSQFQHY